MNRRMKKKAENVRRKKLHRVLDQVLDINGLETRSVKETGNKPTVFFWLSGHVGTVTVDICYDGWEAGKNPDFSKKIGLESDKYEDGLDDVIKQLDYIRWRYRV